MKKQRLLTFITVIFTSIALMACVPAGQNSPWQTNSQLPTPAPVVVNNAEQAIPLSADGKIKVAILLPLSGSTGEIGQSMLKAAQLALFELNNERFILIPRDTGGDATQAKEAAESVVKEGAQLILGPLFAGSVRAVKPVARQNDVKMIAFSTDWSQADSNTFLMGFMPFSQVDRIASYAVKQGLTEVSIVSPRDKYGDIVTDRFQKAMRDNGGLARNVLRISPNAPDLGAMIASLPKDLSDAIFMPIGGQMTQIVSDYLDQAGFSPSKYRRLGTGLWDNPAIARQQTMQGGWFAAPSPSGRRSFENLYKDAYGVNPTRIATLAFDATALASTLAQNGLSMGRGPDFTFGAITNRSGFAGTDGVFRFGRGGIVERKLAVLELKNGQIVEIDPAERKF